jgi:excisionase family DNA binding protein
MLLFLTIHLATSMRSSPAENSIMTIVEVADYLKVTERTIYRLAGVKQAPAFKVGGAGDSLKWKLSNGSETNLPALTNQNLQTHIFRSNQSNQNQW